MCPITNRIPSPQIRIDECRLPTGDSGAQRTWVTVLIKKALLLYIDKKSWISMILVNPPVVKPCEAPAGIAKLTGALHHHGIACEVFDANAQSLLGEREAPQKSSDAWTRRAFRHHSKNLLLLKDRGGYENFDRYKQAVLGINHVLETQASPSGVLLSLSNYEDERLSPLKSKDLSQGS